MLTFKLGLHGAPTHQTGLEAELRGAATSALTALRNQYRSPLLYDFGEQVNLGNGNQATKTDHRFEAVLNAIAQVLGQITFTLDVATLPEDLSKMDLDTLGRIFLEIGAELERRKPNV